MDLDLAAVTAPAQVVEILVNQESVEEPPAIDMGQAPTMDNVIPVPQCAALITCAHAPPLASRSNQLLLSTARTTAPLLVTEPSFPPVTQGPISMLPCMPIAFSGVPGAPVAPPAPYGVPPALYGTMQSTGALHSATLQPMASMPGSGQPTPVHLWPLQLGQCTCLLCKLSLKS